jgi:hypothetical protein
MLRKFILIVAILFLAASHASAEDYDFSTLGISGNDKEIGRKALAASQRGDWQGARQIAERASDRIIYKIILWREFKEARTTSSKDIMEFLDSSDNWPLLRRWNTSPLSWPTVC